MPVSHKAALLLVYPNEPGFMVKGKYQFELSAKQLATRYRSIGDKVLEHCNNKDVQKIPVKALETYPDLTNLKTFPKSHGFSSFNSEHHKYATELYKILNAARDMDELISIALYVRDEINVQLFVYVYYLVVSHRFVNVVLPNVFEIAPHCFVKKDILQQLKAVCNSSADTNKKPIVVKFRTQNVTNPEERLAFFREDIGINSHHFHWHVVYPPFGDDAISKKDRRGELFYFMHHQMCNTYHANRLTAHILPVVPFTNFRAMMKDGYCPNMTTFTSSQNFPPRQDNIKLQDIERDNKYVGDMERWYDRLQEAADQGYCLDPKGGKINLISEEGFDDFVNLAEPNSLSKNLKYYGKLHNNGHGMIGNVHDPTGKYKEPAAVMGYTQTATRDPMFFQWHQMFDNLCMKVKDQLPPYTNAQLAFQGIKMQSIELLDANNKPFDKDQLITYWQQSDIDLSNGLDFQSHQAAYVRLTHLNYRAFTYSMKVENSNAAAVLGTIRIFIVPIYNEKNEPYDYEVARKRAIELDQFVVSFPPGLVRVIRKDIDSSLTIRHDRTYPNEKNVVPFSVDDQPTGVQAECMCGWPQNLLLPKGDAVGYPFYLYAMVSDYNADKIEQPASNGACNDNYVLCGLRNRKYPDKRSMGFPFDRKISDAPGDLKKFAANYGNMIVKSITIRHLAENTAQIGDDPSNTTHL